MFDIIYVRETHPLAAQIAFLHQMYSQQMITDPSYCIPIDPAARLVYILHILIWIVYFLMVLSPRYLFTMLVYWLLVSVAE